MKQVLRLTGFALSPQLVFAAKPISIHADFEGAALGKIVRLSETHFRCGVKGESDQDGRNRQASWHYFRVVRCRRKVSNISTLYHVSILEPIWRGRCGGP